MNELVDQLRRLPKLPITCEGGVFEFPQRVRVDEGASFRPRLPLWCDAKSHALHFNAVLGPDENELVAALESLGGFVNEFLGGQGCPACLKVRDSELAEYLRVRLAGAGIEIELVKRLPALEAVAAEMFELFEVSAEEPPGLLDARGVTVERVRSFAEAAADWFRAAPWRQLSDADLIQIESPKPPRGLSWCVVLGAGGSTYGMAFYPSRAAYNRFLQAGRSDEFDSSSTAGLTQLFFEAMDALPEADARLWVEHDLPVVEEGAYPFPVKITSQGRVARPSKRELSFFEAILAALAATTEEELDSGRWRKEVATCDGPALVTLAIPDLLEPPSPREWLQRGFSPDRRALERVFADAHRYLGQNPPGAEDDLPDFSELFAGRTIDEPLTQPNTPAEQAQALCFQAFDVRGRRCVQLARQALQLDPNCADAYVILAEQAGSSEARIAYYRQGVDAAERSLEAEVFEEDVGRFWEIFSTRPYMRARFGLAESLAGVGDLDEAIEHEQDLLRLNPNDNLGVRYALLPRLLAAGRDLEAARLLKQYDEESAIWAYSRALIAYRLDGPSAAADRELAAALDFNPYVVELIHSDLTPPQPTSYGPGTAEEACVAAEELRPAFQSVPGFLDWIKNARRRLDRAELLQRRKKRRKPPEKRNKRKGR